MNGTNGVSVSKVAQIMDLYNFLPRMYLHRQLLLMLLHIMRMLQFSLLHNISSF